jgi:hypothetical protein
MRNRERFNAILDFRPVDRMPVIEPFKWWELTLNRWREEGLPADIDLFEYFGLDKHIQIWIGPGPEDNPEGEPGCGWHVSSMDGYIAAQEHIYPRVAFDAGMVDALRASHDAGDIFFWITVEGFFWWPRVLMGIEGHLYSFYDTPELMHRINRDLLEYNKRVIAEVCRVDVPDFMTVAEDMSYRSGPMIGKEHFDEFMKPYYIELTAHAKECGIGKVLVDTDGNFYRLAPWFHGECGVDGFVPCERQAGMDLAELRSRHPRLNIIGGFDKMRMSGTEDDMRAEFEHAMPALRTGGVILGTDHQTPPEVSLEGYKRYVKLLKEYAGEVGGL